MWPKPILKRFFYLVTGWSARFYAHFWHWGRIHSTQEWSGPIPDLSDATKIRPSSGNSVVIDIKLLRFLHTFSTIGTLTHPYPLFNMLYVTLCTFLSLWESAEKIWESMQKFINKLTFVLTISAFCRNALEGRYWEEKEHDVLIRWAVISCTIQKLLLKNGT